MLILQNISQSEDQRGKKKEKANKHFPGPQNLKCIFIIEAGILVQKNQFRLSLGWCTLTQQFQPSNSVIFSSCEEYSWCIEHLYEFQNMLNQLLLMSYDFHWNFIECIDEFGKNCYINNTEFFHT